MISNYHIANSKTFIISFLEWNIYIYSSKVHSIEETPIQKKIFILCDCETKIVMKMLVYTGSEINSVNAVIKKQLW